MVINGNFKDFFGHLHLNPCMKVKHIKACTSNAIINYYVLSYILKFLLSCLLL